MSHITTQQDQIFKHLSTGQRLTALDAYERFGCLRLSGRIYDLRKAGYDVQSRLVEVESGKRVAEYWM
jgi:hypothetical protein